MTITAEQITAEADRLEAEMPWAGQREREAVATENYPAPAPELAAAAR